MKYVKSLFLNFLCVFFANHILPGIDVLDLTKLPHIGGDLLFSVGLGLLNSLIYPTLKLFDRKISAVRIFGLALVINFIAYATLKITAIGIQIVSIEGYLIAAGLVTIASFVTNYLEMKYYRSQPPKIDEPPPSL